MVKSAMKKHEVLVDASRCSRCGTCIRMMKDYCMEDDGGRPVIRRDICNLCQKCIALCPSMALTMDGVAPEKIRKSNAGTSYENIVDLFRMRRSIKHFRDEPVAREVLAEIAASGNYAPNQNKNISVLVVDDKKLVEEIDRNAVAVVRIFYRIMFGIRILYKVVRLMSGQVDVIKIKMEKDLRRGHVLKENTQALLILTGPKRVAVTQSSAHYVMATMLYRAQSLGVANCLMDSVKMTFALRGKLRRRLKINEDVLMVLALGYSGENIVNVPRGYEMEVRWN